jgi:hypothetical protein
MKTLLAALTLATLIAAPAFITPAAARPDARPNYNGTYNGYPLSDWYNQRGSW